MPEQVESKNIYSLTQVTRSIQNTLNARYSSSFWVKAEMNKLNYYSHSGHCYPELVEKQDGKVVAQMKSTLWKSDYLHANESFLRVLKEPLKDGIKILFLASVTFDSVHGLSLRIHEIDPAYTLGDIEKEKTETIKKLREEKIFGLNKSLKPSLLPKRIAIISVETSKGYADFLNVIDENPWNYKFFHMLFPALLQGEKAVDSIIHQLNRIRKVIGHFDVVAILRGGGGDVGLSCYNHYELARNIALFPIPVLTGIGHATNETVSEMVSWRNGITPTKVAEDLLQQFHQFAVPVQEAQKIISNHAVRLLQQEKKTLHHEVQVFRHVTENILQEQHNNVSSSAQRMKQHARFMFRQESEYLVHQRQKMMMSSSSFIQNSRQQVILVASGMKKDVAGVLSSSKLSVGQQANQLFLYSRHKITTDKSMLDQLLTSVKQGTAQLIRDNHVQLSSDSRNIHNMSPEQVLKRGYSITTLDGKALRNHHEVLPGQVIETRLYNGELQSTINQVKKNNEHE